VTKDELQDAVWTHHFVSESALKGRMNELRQALGEVLEDLHWSDYAALGRRRCW